VLIANEEQSSIKGIGVDQLAQDGELEFLKSGPLYWLDVANFGPVMGSGGMVTWQLHAKGKKAHSGFPTQGINPISLGYECVRFVEERFYKDFPASFECKAYKYKHGSTFKPTSITSPEGSLSQIPEECFIKGDIRMVPFEDTNAVLSAVEGYVKEFNAQVTEISMPGPAGFQSGEQKGEVELSWLGAPTEGIACKLTSIGYQAILQATNDVRGEAKPFSLTGTLPLVREMQMQGYDVQLIGYGRMEGYHAVDEFGLLSEFVQGAEIIVRVIDYLNQAKKFKSDSSDDEV
jgi:acetylornithine deacetylase